MYVCLMNKFILMKKKQWIFLVETWMFLYIHVHVHEDLQILYNVYLVRPIFKTFLDDVQTSICPSFFGSFVIAPKMFLKHDHRHF